MDLFCALSTLRTAIGSRAFTVSVQRCSTDKHWGYSLKTLYCSSTWSNLLHLLKTLSYIGYILCYLLRFMLIN